MTQALYAHMNNKIIKKKKKKGQVNNYTIKFLNNNKAGEISRNELKTKQQ
jgi:hypothetical protein